jgi:shikimate kinase
VNLLESLDARLVPALTRDFEARAHEVLEGLPRGVTVVLAGHRAAGKTTLLPQVASLLGRPSIDLDRELELRHGRLLREWVTTDVEGFRRAEKELFLSLPHGGVVAVGGGFLSHHPDALWGTVTVLVPISFETYVERLSADATRPRLLPSLSLAQELQELFFEREEKHRAARPMGFVEFLLRARQPSRARRVVTLPPGVDPYAFAWRARREGADLLEVRSDLLDPQVDLRVVPRALPLLVAHRTPAVPPAWRRLAHLEDVPLGAGQGPLLSFHAPTPLTVDSALEAWRDVPAGGFVKHVEPLGAPADAARLLETQTRLIERYGEDRVTVLATGPEALPFRALLARKNALDYCAADASFAAAPGQRLLADATREARAPHRTERRLGIFGHGLGHSRSPRLHPQPFDRIDLPEGTDMKVLLAALHPHYRGFAVTNPFKLPVAQAIHARREAINTLVRTAHGWEGFNTDVEGAARTLEALRAERLTVLGEGGATDALKEAARVKAVELTLLRRTSDFSRSLTGTVIWTWPSHVEVPAGLRFEGATVALIAYGAPARVLTARVRELGGRVRGLGPRWFIAQARLQRRLWETAE